MAKTGSEHEPNMRFIHSSVAKSVAPIVPFPDVEVQLLHLKIVFVPVFVVPVKAKVG